MAFPTFDALQFFSGDFPTCAPYRLCEGDRLLHHAIRTDPFDRTKVGALCFSSKNNIIVFNLDIADFAVAFELSRMKVPAGKVLLLARTGQAVEIEWDDPLFEVDGLAAYRVDHEAVEKTLHLLQWHDLNMSREHEAQAHRERVARMIRTSDRLTASGRFGHKRRRDDGGIYDEDDFLPQEELPPCSESA